jgi:hypothetical protein
VNRFLKLLGSLAVTVVFGWWAFRDTRWEDQWASLRSADYVWVLPYLGILLLVHLTRTARWGSLLASQERVRFRSLNDASAIGFMMLLVLPFRLGEFARPFLIAQRSSIRRSAAMTTVVLERIADGVFVSLLLRGLLFVVHTDAPEARLARAGANAMFFIFFGGFLLLLLAAWHHDWAVRVVGTWPHLAGAGRAGGWGGGHLRLGAEAASPESGAAGLPRVDGPLLGAERVRDVGADEGVSVPPRPAPRLRRDVPGGGGGDDSRGARERGDLSGFREAGSVALPARGGGERSRASPTPTSSGSARWRSRSAWA